MIIKNIHKNVFSLILEQSQIQTYKETNAPKNITALLEVNKMTVFDKKYQAALLD